LITLGKILFTFLPHATVCSLVCSFYSIDPTDAIQDFSNFATASSYNWRVRAMSVPMISYVLYRAHGVGSDLRIHTSDLGRNGDRGIAQVMESRAVLRPSSGSARPCGSGSSGVGASDNPEAVQPTRRGASRAII
jgi:hypothetical protein